MLERATRARAATPSPWVVLVTGVNGVGKTTTIGKLAARHVAAGRRVLLVAGGHVPGRGRRAACGVGGADGRRPRPAGDRAPIRRRSSFDGMKAAARPAASTSCWSTPPDVSTRASNLMDELRKVRRVIAREVPGAPHETLLVLDATTGQNAVAQARMFRDAVGVTGLVLTKLDGTARGGVVLAVQHELGRPGPLRRRRGGRRRSPPVRRRASSSTRCSRRRRRRQFAWLDTARTPQLESDPSHTDGMGRETQQGLGSFLVDQQDGEAGEESLRLGWRVWSGRTRSCSNGSDATSASAVRSRAASKASSPVSALWRALSGVAPALRAAPQLHTVRADPLTAVRNDALPGGASEHLEVSAERFDTRPSVPTDRRRRLSSRRGRRTGCGGEPAELSPSTPWC